VHLPLCAQGFSSSGKSGKVLDDEIAQLLENNKAWVEESKAKDPDFFKRIGGPQKPKYLYIGCSDSRVPANEILGLGPGEVFVHRNVGNLVVGSDLNTLSVVEFAVQFLGVKHIIVTGHYDCGAVRASMTKQDLGLLENWIRNIRDVHRMHHSVMDQIDDDELRHKRLVELNVVEQCVTLFKTGVVQRKRKEYRESNNSQRGEAVYPAIHAMVFDPKDGILKKLPINFSNIVRNYQHIYNLY
jgi:carbonic anhydrase